jgi:hypothetical protein
MNKYKVLQRVLFKGERDTVYVGFIKECFYWDGLGPQYWVDVQGRERRVSESKIIKRLA